MRSAILHDESRVLDRLELLEELLLLVQSADEVEVLAGAEHDRDVATRAELELRPSGSSR